jgi:hypothetical protein
MLLDEFFTVPIQNFKEKSELTPSFSFAINKTTLKANS